MKRQTIESISLSSIDVLPDDVIWLIFLCLEQQWITREGFSVCNRWRVIVRTQCTLLDSAICGVNRAILQRVPHLRTLIIDTTISGITKDDLARLSNLHTFKIGSQSGDTTTDVLSNLSDTLVTLSTNGTYHLPPLSNLRDLSIHYNNVVHVTTIGSLTTLQSLRLTACCRMTDRCLYTLSSLRSLMIADVNVSDDALSSLVNLTSLEVEHASLITNRGIQRLTGLRELTLRSADRGINEDSLAGLHLLTHLCMVGRNASVNYNALTQLKSLAIYTGQYFTMFNDRHVDALTNLVRLDTDDHLLLSSRWLSHFPSLRDLSMDNIGIDDTLTLAEIRQFTVLECSGLGGGERHCVLKKIAALVSV